MSIVVLPDVVDGVEQSSSGQGGRTTGCVGDVIVLHGDLIVGADHLESPIVVAVAASSGVRRLAINVVAGKSDALARVEAEDVMLAAGTSSLIIMVREESHWQHSDFDKHSTGWCKYSLSHGRPR